MDIANGVSGRKASGKKSLTNIEANAPTDGAAWTTRTIGNVLCALILDIIQDNINHKDASDINRACASAISVTKLEIQNARLTNGEREPLPVANPVIQAKSRIAQMRAEAEALLKELNRQT